MASIRPHTVRLPALVKEELRALPRNAFALAGVAVVLLLLAPAAAFGTGGPTGFSSMQAFTWVVAPLFVSVLVAARIASARRSRFVDSLYTTPLSQRTWLAAQAIVGVVIVLVVLSATIPFVLVFVARLGPSHQLLALLAAGAMVGAFAVAFGLFCGVIVGDAGAAAAAGVAGGGATVSFLGLIVESIFSSNPSDPFAGGMLRVAHISPISLAMDAAQVSVFGVVSDGPWIAGLGLATMTIAFFVAAWLAYTRGQGPLGWERRGGRGAIVALVLVALVLPVASASVDYQQLNERNGSMFDPGEHTSLGFVTPGAPVTDLSLTAYTYFHGTPLSAGEDNARDLLVQLRVPLNATIRDVRVTLDGGSDLDVTAGEPVVDAPARQTRGFGLPGDGVGDLSPVYRVPVVIHPVRANAIRYSHALLGVNVTFVADGHAVASHARITTYSNVPGASLQMLAAGAPPPVACIGGFVARKIKTR